MSALDLLLDRLAADPTAHDGFCGCEVCRSVGQCTATSVVSGVEFVCQARSGHAEDFHANFNEGAPVQWPAQKRSHA